MTKTDFLVIGGGILGISVSRELKKRFKDCRVILLEKENELALHGSGRNSGVLHAGFYYSANSLKAKLTREGNRSLTEYCDYKKLKIFKCGKLVVPKNESELKWLDELLKRAKTNKVELECISEAEAKEIEPRVKTFQRALFSPATSTVDPVEVTRSLAQDAKNEGIEIHTGTIYKGRNGDQIRTNSGDYEAGYIVNCAGLYSDVIAMQYGFSKRHRILPFKGIYLYSNELPGSVKTNIYPVPDLRNPWLGVHFTVTVDGKVKIGPTAMPAFWREQYRGLDNFKFSELMEIAVRQLNLLINSDFDFKRIAVEEFMKYSKQRLIYLASKMLEGTSLERYNQWGKPGIRAQLVDIEKKKLEMDFVLEGDKKSMHILNAVSPGFTCAIPFSNYVCDKIDSHLK